MKLGLYLALASLATVACTSRPVYSPPQRDTASQAEYCVQSFNNATGRLKELINSDVSAFPQEFIVKTNALKPGINITCVKELKNSFGAAVNRQAYSIGLEEQLQGVGNLMESELGVRKMAEYHVDARYVNYDNILVAVSAHSLAEMADVDDKNYDIFFKTLKVLESKSNSK